VIIKFTFLQMLCQFMSLLLHTVPRLVPLLECVALCAVQGNIHSRHRFLFIYLINVLYIRIEM